MNDGFCDICNIFKGHEEVKSLFGILFCEECQDLFTRRTRFQMINEFKRMCGYEPEPEEPPPKETATAEEK